MQLVQSGHGGLRAESTSRSPVDAEPSNIAQSDCHLNDHLMDDCSITVHRESRAFGFRQHRFWRVSRVRSRIPTAVLPTSMSTTGVPARTHRWPVSGTGRRRCTPRTLTHPSCPAGCRRPRTDASRAGEVSAPHESTRVCPVIPVRHDCCCVSRRPRRTRQRGQPT